MENEVLKANHLTTRQTKIIRTKGMDQLRHKRIARVRNKKTQNKKRHLHQ